MYETEIGNLEKYSPLLSIRLPVYLWNTHKEMYLIENRNKLVSFFDLHKTLQYFINLKSTKSIERGVSLFRSIPKNRSCQDASIPDQQCRCLEYRYSNGKEFNSATQLDSSSIIKMIISKLNNKTEKYRSVCSIFEFDEIKSIYFVRINDNNIYKFKLKLQPGDSWFESSVKHVNKTLSLYEDIYRLNIYWKTSQCINNEKLKPFCTCKK
jgi:hypothetical protein